MTTELFWLTLTAATTALLWIPYILDRIAVCGLPVAIANDRAETGEPHSPWAQRAMKAHQNAVENLAVFTVLIVAAHLAEVSSATTEIAAAVYFWSRLAHYLIYAAGVPVLRTLTFATAWSAQMAIVAALLGWA